MAETGKEDVGPARSRSEVSDDEGWIVAGINDSAALCFVSSRQLLHSQTHVDAPFSSL